MDLITVLKDKVNELTTSEMPELKKGYLGTGESFVIYPIPGSRVTNEYYDGDKDMAINFELAMKSLSSQKIHDTLWIVQSLLENLEGLTGEGFEMTDLVIANKPYINQVNDQGWLVFLLDITVEVYVKAEQIN